MLKLDAIDVSIGPVPILRGVTLHVSAGEVVGLLGRNGAGKTTMLRTCMGLLRPSAGKLVWEKVDLIRTPAYQRAALGIGYMPEDRRLVPDMTVMANILVPTWSVAIENASERIARIFVLIPELEPLKDRLAASLSGGQQKLVALARALLVGSTLLLLDEPTEGVAPALAERILTIISSLRERGPAILIAESNAHHVEALAHRIVTIERGEISTRLA